MKIKEVFPSKIAICDDTRTELLDVCKIVDEFIATNLYQCNITYLAFQNGTDLLAAINKGQVFDVFILDVVMPLLNGIDLAEEIRATNSVAKIIFLTSTPEYAVASYRVDAFYYLLKPIKKEALLPLLEKASTDIFNVVEKYILVKGRLGLTKVQLNKLQYVEVLGRTIYFYLRSGEIVEGFGALAQFEYELLCNKQFIKPNRSYIVNMDYIKNLAPDGINTVTDAFIPVSRNMYKEIKQTYIRYCFDGGLE